MASFIRGSTVGGRKHCNGELCLELKIRVGKHLAMMVLLLCSMLIEVTSNTSEISFRNTEKEEVEPQPKAWPEQFHSVLMINNTKKAELQVADLWYDWPNGRNLNLIQHQLGELVHDVEWNNGTSYYYTLGPGGKCRTILFDVGILRPNWLQGATYLGQRHIDGFLCNVWQKVDFLWYYEDFVTRRPVYWLFYTGMAVHVMTFEVGVVLEDSKWQAPAYCFNKKQNQPLARSLQAPHQSLTMRDATPLVIL